MDSEHEKTPGSASRSGDGEAEGIEPRSARIGPGQTGIGPIESRRRTPRRSPSNTVLLAGIFTILAFHTLYVARPFFLPIFLAGLATFVFSPIVRGAARRGIPSPIGAGGVVVVLIVTGGVGITALSGPAAEWIERAPTNLRQAEHKLRPLRAPVERIARATREVQEAATIEDQARTDEVRVSESSLFSDLVLQMQGFLATLVVTLVLLYFLLASHGSAARVLSALPYWRGREKRAADLIEAIESDVSRHLLTVTLINTGLGVAVAAALALLGMPNPALWGAMAAILNFVPFLGAVGGTVIVAGAALISFDEPSRALVTAAVFATLTGLEGFVVTPAVLGRRLTLSPVAVFVSLLLWSFVWGVPGALIAVPLLAVVKIVADRVPPLHVLGLLIGRN